jgi:hypothetical protein
MMARWRVDFVGKVLRSLGSLEAPDENTAIDEAAKEFNTPPARRNKIVVTQVDTKREEVASVAFYCIRCGASAVTKSVHHRIILRQKLRHEHRGIDNAEGKRVSTGVGRVRD